MLHQHRRRTGWRCYGGLYSKGVANHHLRHTAGEPTEGVQETYRDKQRECKQQK